MRPPRLRDGLVKRPRLLRELARLPGAPLVLLVAPAGYGKTVLLSQWAAHDARPFAWVGLRDDDNEPARLLERVGAALDRVAPGSGDPLDRLSDAPPLVLALDDAQVLQEPAALAAVGAMRQVLPPAAQLALASRSEPALPLGRLRAHGTLIELGTRELAMSAAEAGELLAAQGIELDQGEVTTLAQHTEGWPAGLYLAALSLAAQPNGHAAVQRFSGDGRYVADFVRDELLSGLSEDQRRFVRRTAVLDRLSGPLCDAVLHTRGSATALAELSRSNLLLVPLDGGGHWYRYHTLLKEMLRSELRRLEPELEATLHSRACTWYSDHGDGEQAIEHAVGARDVQRAGELMWRDAPAYAGSGRHAKLSHWLAGFTEAEIAGCPRLALVSAQSHLAAGEADEAEHWTVVARAGPLTGREGRKQVDAGLALMQAAIARAGLARMAEDARHAHALEPAGSPRRADCRLLEGVARHLSGDLEGARSRLQEGMRAAAVQSPSTHALCLAQLALLALDEEDDESAAWLAGRAKAVVSATPDLSGSPAAALVFAASAVARAGRGKLAEASDDRRRALALLGDLSSLPAWYECEARTVLGRACLRLSDSGAAGELLAESSRLLRQVPDAALLERWLDELRLQLSAADGSAQADAWSLTTAELRVVQFLPSHLSFPQIAERLCVSPNTVKTHVRAVYRKLDASSRGQAVELAQGNGLLDSGRLLVGTHDEHGPQAAGEHVP